MGQLIEAKKTVLSEGEAVYALREAWKKLYGEYPSNDSLALLYAQTALETGRWRSIWCYNFGNIKRSGDEDYCMFRCNEVINGKLEWFDPPHRQTWFRAYPSALDGAYDYICFLSQKKRYKSAWEAIKIGNPTLYSHNLKVAGYYTANETLYTKGVVSLTNEFKRKADKLLAWTPEPAEAPITIVPTGDDVTEEISVDHSVSEITLPAVNFAPKVHDEELMPLKVSPIWILLISILRLLRTLFGRK